MPRWRARSGPSWTNGSLAAQQKLLRETGSKKVVVVGHWLVGTQLALRLALENPDRVAAVVLLAGSANRPLGRDASRSVPVSSRVKAIDEGMAPKWFRTDLPPGNDYMAAFLRLSWNRVLGSVPALKAQTIPGTRVIMWADRPGAIDEAVTGFVAEVLSRPPD